MVGLETGLSQAAMFAASGHPKAPREVKPQGKEWTDRTLAEARRGVQQFVGETLFGLMLKELRKTTSNDHLLFGGRGEQTLLPMFDQELAKHLATSSNFGLVQATFERLYPGAPGSKIFSPGKAEAWLAKERS